MAGIHALDELIQSMSPELQPGEFVFCKVNGPLTDFVQLDPLATFQEQEALTLVLPAATATKANLPSEGRYRQITLSVHSSLDAVGLTAAVSAKLTDHGISANVVAAYYHDHIFVQAEKAESALAALKELSTTG